MKHRRLSFSLSLLWFLLTLSLGSAAHAQTAEPLHLRLAVTPSMVGSWSGLVAYEKRYWQRHLPPGLRVDVQVAMRGPVIAAALRDGNIHLGYIGDLPAVTLVATGPQAVLVGVAALSQDLCVLVVRRDAPAFATPDEGIRWLAGKRFAISPGTCQQRVAQRAFARVKAQPGRTLNLGSETYAMAFKEDRIDAAGANEIGAASLIEAGLARRLYSSQASGAWDAVFIASTATFARKNAGLLRGWLQAELEAQRFMADARNADEVIRIVAKYLPNVPERALRLAHHGHYPASQGGAAVRRIFPFSFSANAMAVVRDAHHSAQQLGMAPAGELRPSAIQRDITQDLLRTHGLVSPLGEVRARSDVTPH